MSTHIRAILSGAAMAASLAAAAQTAAPSPAAKPVAGAYHSAFEGYRPFVAEEVGDWRKANDTVRDIGGWRAYAREIQGATPARPAASPASAAPAHPHGGHPK